MEEEQARARHSPQYFNHRHRPIGLHRVLADGLCTLYANPSASPSDRATGEGSNRDESSPD
jgi:hypothetical protein